MPAQKSREASERMADNDEFDRLILELQSTARALPAAGDLRRVEGWLRLLHLAVANRRRRDAQRARSVYSATGMPAVRSSSSCHPHRPPPHP